MMKIFTRVAQLLGFLLLAAGVILLLCGNEMIVRQILSREISLRDGTDAMKRWLKPPQPLHFKVYLWNVTNPAEVIAGEKPILAEVGPYVYEQWLEKENVNAEEKDILSYNLKSTLVFSQALTGDLRESDSVTILHIPKLGMILKVHGMMPQFLEMLEDTWSRLFPGIEDIFVTGAVRDVLFGGLLIDCTAKDFKVSAICNNLAGDLPKTIRKAGEKEFKFSFFSYKNGTSKDVVRVFRGVEDLKKLGKISSFNNKTSVEKWDDKFCDMINGSDGSQLPVNLKGTDVVYLFQSDICRSVYARYEMEKSKDGVKLLRFVTTKDMLATPEENPSNECFFRQKIKIPEAASSFVEQTPGDGSDEPDKSCWKSGALVLTPCWGAPIVLTFPHFYLADDSFSQYVRLSPDKKLHETFVEVEPMTGIPVAAKKRIQFNMEVKQIQEVQSMRNLTPGLFPVLWVEEGMQLSEENFSKLKRSVRTVKVVPLAAYAAAGLGIVILAAVVLYGAKKGGTLCWESASAEIRGGGANGYVADGPHSRQLKLIGDRLGLMPETLKRNHLTVDKSILSPRRSGRVFPRLSGVNYAFRENYM